MPFKTLARYRRYAERPPYSLSQFLWIRRRTNFKMGATMHSPFYLQSIPSEHARSPGPTRE